MLLDVISAVHRDAYHIPAPTTMRAQALEEARAATEIDCRTH
jgi:hypothetical protein